MTIYGVSFDSIEDNRRFAELYGFPFKLLSDLDRTMGVAYGAADRPTDRYAKRISYLIDRGTIAEVYTVKDVAGHAAQVLADVKKVG